MSRLTPKQANFVSAYIRNRCNATKAAQEAYHTQTYAAARVTGSRLLTNANIKHALWVAGRQYDEVDIMQSVTQIHKELLQSKNPRVSMKAITLFYKIAGYIG